jgi:outer membrane protein assembly factor BamB
MQVVSSRSFDGAVCTDAAMIDNLAYFGISGESGYEFVCVDLSDELKTVWEYKSEDRISSAAVYGDYVVFGCGSKLVSCDYKSGAATETEIGAEISGAPFAGEYAIYLSGADGNVYKLRLNDDGTAEDGTLTPCEVGGTLSSPLAWNGRVYVSSSEGFYILDSLNMDIMQSYPEIKSGTDPIVCYGNGSRVYLVAQSTDYWCLYSIYDIDDLDEPDVSQLAKLENFEGGRIAVGSGGTMYFRDGVGRLYALAVAPYSILMIVIKLILLLALIVILFIWLRQWAKQRNAKKPPQY